MFKTNQISKMMLFVSLPKQLLMSAFFSSSEKTSDEPAEMVDGIASIPGVVVACNSGDGVEVLESVTCDDVNAIDGDLGIRVSKANWRKFKKSLA